MIALVVRKIVLSHISETPEKDIGQILSIAREMAITPREEKHKEEQPKPDTEVKKEEIEALVKERMKLSVNEGVTK